MSSLQRTKRVWFSVIAFIPLLLAPLRDSAIPAAVVTSDKGKAEKRLNSAYCQKVTLRDYLLPIKSMASIHRIPESGHLPFASPRVFVRALGEGLRVGKGPVGFIIGDEAVNYARQLEWIVDMKLSLVGRQGQIRKVVASRSRRLGRVKLNDGAGKQAVNVPDRPSFYRVDLSFRRFNGVRLGSYSEYFRAVRPFQKARLSLDRKGASPGDVLFARVENPGTAPLMPSSEARIQRLEGQEWIEVATVVAEGLRPRIREQVPAGLSGPCFPFEVPTSFSPGTYRFVDEVHASVPEKRSWTVRAVFTVN